MATPFTDDAYNKFPSDARTKPATGAKMSLVGNWFEEQVLRDATGVTRTIPDRHVSRTFLLKTFTNRPNFNPPHNETFERIYGARRFDINETTSSAYGAGAPFPTRQVGDRLKEDVDKFREYAEGLMEHEEAEEEQERNAKTFEATTAMDFSRPDVSGRAAAEHGRRMLTKELHAGPPENPDRMLANGGCNANNMAHYSTQVPITRHQEALADPTTAHCAPTTAATGFNKLGKNSHFSKPINEYHRTTWGDDEYEATEKDNDLNVMYEDMKTMVGMPAPNVAPVHPQLPAGIPQLTQVKIRVRRVFVEKYGYNAFGTLRRRLLDNANHEGFVPKGAADAVVREEGVTEDLVSPLMMDKFLKILCTMSKTELRANDMTNSLHPTVPNATTSMLLDAFSKLGGGQESIPTDALRGLATTEGAQQALAMAFPGPTVAKHQFLELFSDVACSVDEDEELVHALQVEFGLPCQDPRAELHATLG
eukprot:CAMPEP_0204270932 /NCGR_PEP_ID=MMETSP0468-20130131/19172_1 /ASSEMBLY_ACC=CAM_ASM_000383 /TAXON_ID=2969 /ORGANISM="Oxyrrhis marina" /LENGTH=478 /DNA_ID=CAMNT_0051246527 /DNA_START=49 /DNA_END=1485 /DNA_ORIENTATION=-